MRHGRRHSFNALFVLPNVLKDSMKGFAGKGQYDLGVRQGSMIAE